MGFFLQLFPVILILWRGVLVEIKSFSSMVCHNPAVLFKGPLALSLHSFLKVNFPVIKCYV